MRLLAPVDKVLQLRRVPLFGDLSPARLELLVVHASEELIAAGTVFQVVGQRVEKIRVVVDGEIFLQTPGGEPWQLPTDTVVGVFEYLAGAARVELRAATDVVVLSIPTDAIHQILEEEFDIVVHLFRGMGRTLIRALRETPARASSERIPASPAHMDPPLLDEVDQILALRRALPFRKASVDGLASLVRTMHVENFARGDVLWRASDDATWLGVILRGIVEGETAGRPPSLFYFSEDSTNALGFLDTLGDDKRWYDARAITAVTVLTIKKDDLLDTLEDRFDMALTCLEAFAEFSLGLLGTLHEGRAP